MRRIMVVLAVVAVMAALLVLGGGLALGEINEKACTQGKAESVNSVVDQDTSVVGAPQCQVNTPEAKAGGVV